VLGDRIEIIEAGALDGLSDEEVAIQAKKAGGGVLVTRLRGGSEVKVREGMVSPRLQECIRSLERRAELILLLCTGDFPPLKSPLPLLYPGPTLRNVVQSLAISRLGVLTPAREQIEPQRERWKDLVGSVVIEPVSPYGSPEELETAAARLRKADVELVAMDCIGYTPPMKRQVRSRLDRPVLLASTLLARVAAELLESH
jgi:protein AroM